MHRLSSVFFLALVAVSLAEIRTIVLNTVVRDFKATPQSGSHPDFESDCGDNRGVVGTFLDADGKPYLTVASTSTIHSAAGFAQWYRDVSGVNIALYKTLTLTETGEGTGIFQIVNNNYFPIDGQGWAPGYYQSSGHNFHFTTEIATEFTYVGKETFTFVGDDDVWVYINNKLAVDLGGCHGPQTGSVNLDSAATFLNITVGGTYSLKIFNAERHTTGSNFGVTTSLKLIPKPVNICGDGILQAPEACDDGAMNGKTGSCCNTTCGFSPAGSTCRPVAGGCDVAETCSGSSSVCPADSVKPLGTPCGQLFGACDVQLQKSCDGVAATCYVAPTAVSVLGSSFSDFTVTSFNSYTCKGGDVEGRIAVRNNALFDFYTAGQELRLASDGFKLVTVLVGGNAQWSAGSILPDGTQPAVSGPQSFIYTGGEFTGDASRYLASQYVGNVSGTIDAAFGAAQKYYTQLQNDLAALPINAAASLQYGDGLSITCNSRTDNLYHLAVDAAVLSGVNWYATSNCNFAARWIIDVTGSGSVSFQGSPFSGIVERVVYNILGSGRTVTANNGVAGHLLAPNNIFNQPVGVTYGLVVFGDIKIAKQNNKPNCKNFGNVTLTSKLSVGLRSGDKIIYVVDLPDYAVGDLVCIGGECRKVVSGAVASTPKRQSGGAAITVDTPFNFAHSANTFVLTSLAADASRSDLITYEVASQSQNDPFANPSSSAQLVASAVLLLIALFL